MTDFWAERETSRRRSADLQHKQHADRLTFWVTLASTIIALLAVGAAVWSAYEAHITRVNDEAALLTLDAYQPLANEGPDTNGLSGRLQNYGKYPAKNITVTCITADETDGRKVNWPKSTATTATFPYLLPDHWARITCPPNQKPFNPSNQAKLVQLGVIHYSGDSEVPSVTPFCFTVTYSPGQQANVVLCPDSRSLPDLK